MANVEQLAILKQGIEYWNNRRSENPAARIDLSRANLKGAELSHANFDGSNLKDADLREAMLIVASLDGAHLEGASLIDAELDGAILRVAQLNGSDLHGANLMGADLRWSSLVETNLENCRFGDTIFGAVDLSGAKGLETTIHVLPSTIGIDTIYQSKGKIPEIFLRGAGVPENFIMYVHSLTAKAFDFYSCFISHSTKDKLFCERLYVDLQARGVRAFYFPEDAKWGETVWGEIDRGIKIYDKLVVVLSENSLQSKPVLREIQRALDREDKEHKNILFPITLDRYVFDNWEHERKADVLEKVVGDFSGWDKDAGKYAKAFEKLLDGLQSS